MKKLKEEKIEFDDKVKCLEDGAIEQIAEVLVFIAKEIYQKEKELNQPSRDFKIESGSVFYLDSKNYGRKS